jgi:hypothetical protein
VAGGVAAALVSAFLFAVTFIGIASMALAIGAHLRFPRAVVVLACLAPTGQTPQDEDADDDRECGVPGVNAVGVAGAQGQDDSNHGYDYHGQDQSRREAGDRAGRPVLLGCYSRGAEDGEVGELGFQFGAGPGGQDASGAVVEFLGGQAAGFEVLGEFGEGRVAVGVRDAQGAGGEAAGAGRAAWSRTGGAL